MKNTVIRASAGSGKTYQLSNRFLRQIFDAPSVESALDSILAATFTCKAAGEITDRIFTKFAEITVDPVQRDNLRDDLRYPRWSDETKELQKRLTELAKNMYRMRVGTIDSYFNRIASVFSLELGLPPGWSMLDDADYERLLVEAARVVFEDSERNGAKRLMSLFQRGQNEVSIISDLVDLAADMLPLVRSTKPEAWEHDRPGKLRELTEGAFDNDRLYASVARLEKAGPPGHASFRRELAKLLGMFFDENDIKTAETVKWKGVLGHGLVQKIIAKEESYWIPIPDDIRNAIRPLIDQGNGVLIKYLIDETVAARDLLKLVAAKLDELMIRERKFRFDDVTRKVAEYGFDETRLRSLSHRLNGDTKHLLLDEFQDTSMPQWKVLRPLVERIAKDEDGMFFCVGDEKQAIYSWRGGVAAIFATMKDNLSRLKVDVDDIQMNTTRRNRPPIIDAVNTVFQNIRDNDSVRSVSKDAGKAWQERFRKHESHEKDTGYCSLEESPAPQEGETKADAHLDYVVERIIEAAKIVENRPSLKKGVGVLVLSGEFGAKIVTRLKRRGIEVNGGGGSLADSAAVRYVLSALTLADHPGHTVARYHLATGPLKETLGLKDDANLEKYGDTLVSRRIRDDLTTNGYGETVRKYAEALAPSCDPHEFLRLEKLMESAYRFDDETDGIRTKTFIEKVKNTNVRSPDAANITVSTVHGAKGLEYDIVVLPHLDFEYSGKKFKPKFVVGHKKPNDKTSPIDFVFRYVLEDQQNLLPPTYQNAFKRQIQGEVEEALSELYVAMTRAIRQLVMIVPPKVDDSVTSKFSDLLRCGLVRGKKPVSERILYEGGEKEWFKSIEVVESVKSQEEIRELECKIPDKKVFRHVCRIVPSQLHKEIDAKDPGKKGGKGPVWGTAMHACFEHGVLWLDQTGETDDRKLCKIVLDAIRDESYSFKPENVVAEFHEVCKNPVIIGALSRKRYASPNVKVEAERRFSVWLGDEIMHGSIDRLVVGHDANGKITEIEILDYKTDAGNDVATLVAAYREQLEAYKKGVAALFRVETEMVEATLVFTTLGRTESI